MSGFVPCYPCPLGTYQPEEGKNSCYKCPHGADTLTTAATNITDCEGKYPCIIHLTEIRLEDPLILLGKKLKNVKKNVEKKNLESLDTKIIPPSFQTSEVLNLNIGITMNFI